MDKEPLLSICIPIYNRKRYLERMLSRFMDDILLFNEAIHLYISDNCSTDDIKSVVESFSEKGLNIEYHRNESNLGMDGNFINCFKHAKGKYTWLLGSDDVPQKGFIVKLLSILSNNELGLLHLSKQKGIGPGKLVEYTDSNKICEDIHVWITFISGNIVKTDKLTTVDLECYLGTSICQVPLYLNAILTSHKNAIYYDSFIEDGDDSKNNGGYNLFNVFVENLFSIIQGYVDRGLINRSSYQQIKFNSFKYWLAGLIVELLIYGKADERKSLDVSNSWAIIRKYYGRYPYSYYFVVKKIISDKVKFVFGI